MNIRTLQAHDYDAAYALWLSCPGMRLNDIDDSRAGFERFLARNPDTCFAALEDLRIVGVIMAGYDGRRGYLYHAAVDAACRHRGIGRVLVETALRALREQGVAKAALVVFDRNEDGKRFWEKMGFAARDDLSYHDVKLLDMTRIDT